MSDYWSNDFVAQFLNATNNAAGGDPFGDKQAAQAQMDAQAQALEQQKQLANQARNDFLQASSQGAATIRLGASQATAALKAGQTGAENYYMSGLSGGQGALASGQAASLGSLSSGYGQGRQDLASGYGQARSDLGRLAGLQSYGSGAAQAINPYDITSRAPDRLAAMSDRGLYSGFEQDPGYQFRLQQGEQAINRSAAAHGGRLGGATLKALSDYGQQTASQEFQNFAARRQAEAGVAGQADQYQLAALTNQAGRSDTAALQAQQNQLALANLGYGAQGQLAGLASQYGAQQSGLSSQLGTQQAGIQQQYGQNLADMYSQTYGNLANTATSTGSNLANVYANAGQNQANIAIGVGANAQSNAQGLAGAYQNYAQYGGMAQQAAANSTRETAAGLAALFSDRRLKNNITFDHDSSFGSIGLRRATWTWNEQAAALGLVGNASGVIAQEVAEKYPHAVLVHANGYMMVDYGELQRMMQEAA